MRRQEVASDESRQRYDGLCLAQALGRTPYLAPIPSSRSGPHLRADAKSSRMDPAPRTDAQGSRLKSKTNPQVTHPILL